MAKDWIERRNIDFRQQAKRFAESIAADAGGYGVDPADAALLAAEFADFDAKYQAAYSSLTRTALGIMARDRARKVLARRMRNIAAIVRGNPSVTIAMRLALGMTIEGKAEPAPECAPTSEPWIQVVSLVSNRLTLRLKDSGSSRRGIPRHCTGAQIFMATGAHFAAPSDITQWRLLAVTSKAQSFAYLPKLPAGTEVSLAARWFNTHGAGPTSQAAHVWVGRMLMLPKLQAA